MSRFLTLDPVFLYHYSFRSIEIIIVFSMDSWKRCTRDSGSKVCCKVSPVLKLKLSRMKRLSSCMRAALNTTGRRARRHRASFIMSADHTIWAAA